MSRTELEKIKLKTQDGHTIKIGDVLYTSRNEGGFKVTTKWYFKQSQLDDANLMGIFKDKNLISPKLKKRE